MKTFKCIIATLFLGISLSASAQCDVDAGQNQTIPYNGSVQLNASALQKAKWETLNAGTTSNLNSTFFTSANVGYAAGAAGTILKTTDGGNTWSALTTGATAIFYSIAFGNEQIGCAAPSTAGYIYRTTDAGSTWTQISISAGVIIRSISFVSQNTVYMVGYISSGSSYTGVVLKSTDGGATWSQPVTVCSTLLQAIHFTSPTTGYVTGSYDTVYKTTDGGATWVLSTNGLYINPSSTTTYYGIDFASANVGCISGTSGQIYKTTNGGSSWSSCANGYVITDTTVYGLGRSIKSYSINSISCISADTMYAVASYTSNTIIMKTVDGGQSWYQQLSTSASKPKFNSICFPTSKIGYVVGNTGAAYRWNETESYSWSPATGLSATNITNPIANPKTTTTYTVTRTTHNCTSTDDITVYIEPVSGNYKTITCGESVQLDAIPANYTGIGKIRYKWTPSTGLDNDTIARPTTSVTSDTKYVGTVTLPTGSVIKDSVTIYVRAITVNAGTDKTVVCGGSVEFDPLITDYTGTGVLKYKWTPSTGLNNDTIPNPIATPSSDITYTVTVTSPGGCSSADKVTVHIQEFQALTTRYIRNLTCGSSIQFDNVPTNYTGTGTLKYKWTPSTGLNSDTLATPICSSIKSQTYYVTITTPNGCSSVASVILLVDGPSVNLGNNKTVACGSSVQLDEVTTNYIGAGKTRYKWSPSTGLNNDTIPNPIATLTATTDYTLTVTTPNGCTTTIGYLTVTVTPATVDAGTYKTVTCGTTTKLDGVKTNYTGTGKLKYKWTPATGLDNDTIANPTVTTTQKRTYTLTVSVPGGCVATDTVSVLYVATAKPQLALVGVNAANKNILSWNKTYSNAQAINIYKETNVTNSYAKIGSVQYDSASSFVDTLSLPDVQSNKYKVSILDRCGFESPMSDYHKTMHLSINKGINTIWNLIWEAYEGYAVSTYNIYRGTTPANIQIIGSLSGSNTQFSDYTAPTGYVYYQVEAVSSIASGARQQAKSTSEVSYYSSRSNIATNKSGTDGLYNVKDISDRLSISPNPASGAVRLTVDDQGAADMQLYIYNGVGQLVKTQDNVYNGQTIDVNTLNNGLYMLVVKSQGFTGMHKLLIQK
jgi:photosystem II stability/assembly factor-like uncharacterized protein